MAAKPGVKPRAWETLSDSQKHRLWCNDDPRVPEEYKEWRRTKEHGCRKSWDELSDNSRRSLYYRGDPRVPSHWEPAMTEGSTRRPMARRFNKERALERQKTKVEKWERVVVVNQIKFIAKFQRRYHEGHDKAVGEE